MRGELQHGQRKPSKASEDAAAKKAAKDAAVKREAADKEAGSGTGAGMIACSLFVPVFRTLACSRCSRPRKMAFMRLCESEPLSLNNWRQQKLGGRKETAPWCCMAGCFQVEVPTNTDLDMW